jgi:hypothetical protein
MTEDKIKRGYGGGLQAIDFSDLSRQIEEAKKKSKLLKGSAVALLVVSLLIGYLLFNYFVLRYAVIEDLQMIQDTSRPTWVYFTFLVKEGGVVERGYERAVSEDIVSANNRPKFEWNWFVDKSKHDFSVYTRSRWGIFPTWQTRTFSLPGNR